MKLIPVYIIISFFVCSCSSNLDFLNDYPTVNTPYADTLNFSNFNQKKVLNKRKIKKLDLYSIFGEEYKSRKNNTLGVLARVNLSENFKSVLVYNNHQDKQLSSVLATYNKNNKLIDYKVTSFTELFDGIIRTTSIIYKGRVNSTEHNLYSSEKLNLKYQITTNGKIIRK